MDFGGGPRFCLGTVGASFNFLGNKIPKKTFQTGPGEWAPFCPPGVGQAKRLVHENRRGDSVAGDKSQGDKNFWGNVARGSPFAPPGRVLPRGILVGKPQQSIKKPKGPPRGGGRGLGNPGGPGRDGKNPKKKFWAPGKIFKAGGGGSGGKP